jgi:hypothetical protein
MLAARRRAEMGWFEKIVALPQLQTFFSLDDDAFVEEKGWQTILNKVKQLKDPEFVTKVIREANANNEKEKIVLGYLCTMAAEGADEPVTLPCVDYAGCYLGRGEMKLKSRSHGVSPNYVGMGMNASSLETKLTVDGNVGDYLGYRASQANIEVTGSAKENAGMAIGYGSMKIDGDVAGALGGNTQSTRLEVGGSVGSIGNDNVGCTILIGADINWGIGENQQDCFIKVCGSVGVKARKSEKHLNIATGLCRNSILLVGENVYGNLGKGMEVAKVFVWGRVHGQIEVSDIGGGFVYLNKRKNRLLDRLKSVIGGSIGIKYVKLKESGYLFAEEPDDIKDIVLK